jgi:hypothetical protein
MNCALHVVGIVILFLGAVLPLSLLPVTVFGFQVNLGILLAIPVLVYWILLDFPIAWQSPALPRFCSLQPRQSRTTRALRLSGQSRLFCF